ncbi:DUF6292 family protein [Streptomyces sp. LHD-70]|uniref:DUF6292 family protein n=1 Tax=Streptomyces sp. LHD-70 TaxID=3072140 RepID=UPI00280F5FA3|nr:DUF6292 family protein [Streptomyces sp. LHD-70]MDQ8707582.1 DUF6292 family protein [Streptomyces sp. LHD-70]
MIRAGRREHVRTTADLAVGCGLSLGTYRKKRPYAEEGHPAPVSSEGARVQLWDGEQTDAYYAGKPVPELPSIDSDEDLLDRNEAAAEIGVGAKTWDGYKKDPALREHLVVVGGVEHWPRRIVHAFQSARPGKPAATGRPKGAGDLIPREELLERVAELLDEEPAISSAGVVDALGVHQATAQNALAQLRGQRIAELIEAEPQLDPRQAALQLGYPAAAHRRSLAAAAVELRARQTRPYLEGVAAALEAAGVELAGELEFQVVGEQHVAAALVLGAAAEAPALVWDERYGWRTAMNRRHPIGKDTGAPTTGPGIRYLGTGTTPDADDVVVQLQDGRRGHKHP